jgi:hypothetical protein
MRRCAPGSVILILMTLFLGFAAQALATDRYALVIGNDHYVNLDGSGQLERAIADSVEVAETLERLGFRVIRRQDATRQAMVDALSELGQSIKPGDIALFFFAGHGVAIGGANYLLPTDVPDIGEGQEARAARSALSEADVIEELQERKAQVSILILDACRDNPFRRPGTRSVGQERGLTRIPEPPRGVFVLYSAGHGQKALDNLGSGDNSNVSVFTRELVTLLGSRGLHLGDLAFELRRRVASLAATIGHTQVPAVYDQIVGDRIYLNGDGGKPAETMSPDFVAWDALGAEPTTAQLREFLRRYPESRLRPDVERRLASRTPAFAPPPPAARPAKPTAPVATESRQPSSAASPGRAKGSRSSPASPTKETLAERPTRPAGRTSTRGTSSAAGSGRCFTFAGGQRFCE